MIKLEKVSKVYENSTVALSDISLQLPKKGMVAIIGTSGSGKSTLLNLLSDNDFPTDGKITYLDKTYNEIGKDQLISQFGYIYQDFKLIDNLTAYQNIMIGHELKESNIDYDFVINIAAELGIKDILDEKVYSLSGGQMQRVAIARAIVRNPKVIFADEPTGNLDNSNSVNVYNILRKLAKDKLVVIVTHDSKIATWADRVITLSDGQIVSNIAGKSVDYVDVESNSNTAEEEDIQEILQMQKSVKSKKTSKIFSFSNKPKSLRKKAGLSPVSSLGLSLSLLNKDIVKKVFLIIVTVILISLMTVSAAMAFANVEKTMANAINSANGDKKIFTVSPVIEKPNYFISYKDMQKFDEILIDNKLDFYEIATGEVIANSWDKMYANNSNAKQVAYFAPLDISDMQNAIFTDYPKEVGIDIILGNSPKKTNEIAISKTYYEYLLHYKYFAFDSDGYTYDIIFTKDNLIKNQNIKDIFGVEICGVFEDNNGLDANLKEKEFSSLTESEQENLVKLVEQEYSTNPLINLIVKCESAKNDWRQFAGVGSNVKMTLENCYGVNNSDYYFDFAPLADSTINYFGMGYEVSSYNLADNQIVVDRATLQKINTFLQSRDKDNFTEITESSTFAMCIVGMATMGNDMYFPEVEYVNRKFTIAGVVESLGDSEGLIVMNEKTFNEIKTIPKFSGVRMVSGEHISASSLKKLNKGFAKYVQSLFDSYTNCTVSYQIKNCPMKQSNDYGIIYICQQYLCIPLLLATIAMTIGIIVIFYFDFIKAKAKDLLILKSLGAKTYDFLSIYLIFCVALTIIQMLFGLLFGNLFIGLINGFVSSLSGYVSTFSVFYLDAFSWVFTIFSVIAVNVISLTISLAGISNKNLRKAFQKLKK